MLSGSFCSVEKNFMFHFKCALPKFGTVVGLESKEYFTLIPLVFEIVIIPSAKQFEELIVN
jgi:hypothetical protein